MYLKKKKRSCVDCEAIMTKKVTQTENKTESSGCKNSEKLYEKRKTFRVNTYKKLFNFI